ncbi:MAG: LLM class flavin-dependent oxidoreductase [Candidatus Binatia bacterium]
MTAPPLRIGLGIPQVLARGTPADATALARFCAVAEAGPFDSLWTLERMTGPVACMEPLTLLAFAAAQTRRLRLGTAVLLTALRSPVVVAKSLATLDQLSAGRLEVGVGFGGGEVDEAFGFPRALRMRRYRESIAALKALWGEEHAHFEGEFWRFRNLAVEPRPRQQPHPPLWIGGRTPAGLRRAVTLGDGWMGAGSTTIAAFRGHAAEVHKLAAAAGRETFPIAKRIYLALDRDRSRARTRLRAWFEEFYGTADLADRVAFAGEIEALLDTVREVREAGASLIVLNPVFDEERQAEEIGAAIARTAW